jgi:hypothetical protein
MSGIVESALMKQRLEGLLMGVSDNTNTLFINPDIDKWTTRPVSYPFVPPNQIDLPQICVSPTRIEIVQEGEKDEALETVCAVLSVRNRVGGLCRPLIESLRSSWSLGFKGIEAAILQFFYPIIYEVVMTADLGYIPIMLSVAHDNLSCSPAFDSLWVLHVRRGS